MEKGERVIAPQLNPLRRGLESTVFFEAAIGGGKLFIQCAFA